jgi:hypothetical protein
MDIQKRLYDIETEIFKIRQELTQSNKVKLDAFKPGDIFDIGNGEEFIFLEKTDSGIASLRKNCLDKEMAFDSNSNNWKTSSLRNYLNNDYLYKIKDVVGTDNIIDHTINLMALDGLTDYKTSIDKISLLTIDQYRKYRYLITPIKGWWWLSTPWSTSSDYFRGVCGVDSGGCVGCRGYDYNCGGVRPFCIFKSSILVSCK